MIRFLPVCGILWARSGSEFILGGETFVKWPHTLDCGFSVVEEASTHTITYKEIREKNHELFFT